MTPSPIDFHRFAEMARPRIDEALDRYSNLGDANLGDANLGDDCPEGLREAIRYSLLSPGKRLRPLLVLMAADACAEQEKTPIETAMPAACAVEMIHAYSLIHDDLPAMDDDDLRRGRPTCHTVYGEAMAILAGDALQALAFETLTMLPVSSDILAEAVRALTHAAGPYCLVGGQADDIRPESIADLDQLRAIHRRKTGAMIEVSLRLGGLSSGADTSRMTALVEYGRRLGLAFQITDDLLDVSGVEAAVGKRLGKDANLGKLTYPGLLGIESSRAEAEKLVCDACGAIAVFEDRAEPLRSLARYVLERTS